MIHPLCIGEKFVNIPNGMGGIWRGELGACVADAVGMMRRAMQLGALEPDLVVTDEHDENQPRKQFIRDKVAALQQKAQADDLVIIHQSSHGWSDSFGQALVYYDGVIYEEEIRSWLAGFKAGVKGIFIADACYSGGLAERGFLQPPIRYAHELPHLSKEFEVGSFGEPEIVSSWAVFSAAAADQPAMDGDEFGAWTGSLLRSPFDLAATTAEGWFRMAKAITPGNQTPTLALLGKDHGWLTSVPLSSFA